MSTSWGDIITIALYLKGIIVANLCDRMAMRMAVHYVHSAIRIEKFLQSCSSSLVAKWTRFIYLRNWSIASSTGHG